MSNSYWVDTFNLDPAHPQASLTSSKTQQERLGIPGKYYGAITWTGGELHLTGSQFGYGAFLRSGSNTNGNVTITDGSTISINNFEEKTILDVSVSYISGAAAPGGEVYFFKRQQ